MTSTEIEIMRSVEDDLWWFNGLRGHVLDRLAQFPPDMKLLDAGCGSGGMLARIRERFPQAELSGLDFSERAVELTRQRNTGAEVVQGSVNELPFPDEAFDVVLSLDVLVVGGVDPHRGAAEMHRVLRPGGTLMINLAAFDFLRGSHDAAANVVRRFTHPRVEALLRQAGFHVEHWSYWNMTLFPIVAIVRWLSRRRAHDPNVRSDLKPMWPPLNFAFTSLVRSELALSRRVSLPFGSSIFAIARK